MSLIIVYSVFGFLSISYLKNNINDETKFNHWIENSYIAFIAAFLHQIICICIFIAKERLLNYEIETLKEVIKNLKEQRIINI